MHHITIQYAGDKMQAPSAQSLRKWAKAALDEHLPNSELTIRIVDADEMQTLNQTYRHKNGPTNVLSFPMEMHDDIKMPVKILGDIIICTQVVNDEAKAQQKSAKAHWAHMVVHGVLHLLGYDHVKDQDAEKMENLEIRILKNLGFANPYTILEIKNLS